MAALRMGPERGFASEWTSRWTECDRRLLVRRPGSRLNGRPSAWAGAHDCGHHRAESSWCVSDPAGGWSRTSAQPDRSGGPHSAGVADCVCWRRRPPAIGFVARSSRSQGRWRPAPPSKDARRRAVVCRVDRGTRCHAVNPTAGQSHPRSGSSGNVSAGTPRQRVSSARALVMPIPAATATAAGPAARACGSHSVARAPRGGARRTTAATGRGVGSICSGSRQSSSTRRGPTITPANVQQVPQ